MCSACTAPNRAAVGFLPLLFAEYDASGCRLAARRGASRRPAARRRRDTQDLRRAHQGQHPQPALPGAARGARPREAPGEDRRQLDHRLRPADPARARWVIASLFFSLTFAHFCSLLLASARLLLTCSLTVAYLCAASRMHTLTKGESIKGKAVYHENISVGLYANQVSEFPHFSHSSLTVLSHFSHISLIFCATGLGHRPARGLVQGPVAAPASVAG